MKTIIFVFILVLAMLISSLGVGGAAQAAVPVNNRSDIVPVPVADAVNDGDSVAMDAISPDSVDLPSGVSVDWWAAVQENIARSEYWVTWQEHTYLDGIDAAYQAPNRAQNLRTYFTAKGIRVIPRTFAGETPPWEWAVTLKRYGYATTALETNADRMQLIKSPVHTVADKNSFEYQYSNLTTPITEWYQNEARGLEQGFTLHAPPQGTGNEIVLELALDGGLTPHLASDGEAIEFTTSLGTTVLRYGELHARDASGRALPARLSLSIGKNGRALDVIRIVIDPAGAVYPVTVDPLATTPGWSVESDQAGANMGWSVGKAGDVNGDGFDDIIVSAYTYNGSAGQAAGRVYVYYGSPAGPSDTDVWIVEGDQAFAALGSSAGSAGDVNNDGYDDVIIGAELYSNGEQHEGRAYLYYGSPAGLGDTPAWHTESNQTDAHFGSSSGTAGDVDGDGYDDVIIGARYYDHGQTNEGQVYVYHGSASGLSTTPAWTAEGDLANINFGYTVGTAGDVDNDGYDDVVIGAYNSSGATKYRLCVYHGSSGGLAATPGWTLETSLSTGLGSAVASAGDVNGDGYDDVIVGEPYYPVSTTVKGRVTIFDGSAAGLVVTATQAITDNQDAYFGYSVGTAGDVNGDGYSDVIVGAPHYEFGGAHKGRVAIYYGSASGSSSAPDWTADGDQDGAEFGGRTVMDR